MSFDTVLVFSTFDKYIFIIEIFYDIALHKFFLQIIGAFSDKIKIDRYIDDFF